MQALRALAGDAYILYFLFTTYDLKQARWHPRASVVACCLDHAFMTGLSPTVTWFTLGLQLLIIAADMQQGMRAQECKLNAVTDMVRCFADVVDGATGPPPGEGPDPVQVIVGLYQAKAAGAH